MYVESLRVDGFGHFDDHPPFAFGPGLVVVHGPNEAGKSTLRQALRWALFGSQRGDRGRWSSRRGQLAVEATLVDGGAPLTLARRDRAVELRRPDRIVAGEAGVAPLLRGADLALFDAIFSFDLFELQQLGELRGERVQALLAVGSTVGGGVHPADVLSALDKEAARWWRPRATCGIRDARQALKEAERAARAAQVEAEEHQGLLARSAHAAERARQLRAAFEAASERRRRLLLLGEAWPVWSRREAASRVLESLGGPATVDPAVRERVEATRERAAAARRDAQQAEEQASAARADLAAVTVDEAVLAVEEPLLALVTRREAAEGDLTALPGALRALDGAEAEVARRLDALGAGWTAARVLALPLDAGHRAEARRHATETASLVAEAPRALGVARASLATAEGRVAAHREELSALAPTPLEAEAEALRACLAGASEGLEGAAELRRVRVALAELAADRAAAPEGWPDLHQADVDEIRTWRERWERATHARDERVAAARVRAAAAEGAVTGAEEGLVAARRAPGAQGPTALEAAAIAEAWAGLAAAHGRIPELEVRSARLEEERRDLPRGLGPAVELETLRTLDVSAGARQGVRRLLEAETLARRELELARGRRDALPAIPDAEVPAAETAERARHQRDLAVRAKAALDVYQGAVARRGPAGVVSGARSAWLGAILLILLAAAAAALAQLALAGAAVVAALVVALVTALGRRARSTGPSPEVAEAGRSLGAALLALGLGREAGRGEVEVALTRAEDELRVLERVAERAASRREEGVRRVQAEAAVARAEDELATARAAARAGLGAMGLPADADRELAESWLGAAERLAAVEAELAAAEEELGGLRARLGAFAEAVARHLPRSSGAAVPPGRAALEAAVAEVAARQARAAAWGEALREAEAELRTATRARDAALRDLALAESAPALPAELTSGWAAWGGARGLPEGPPDVGCLAAARAAAAHTAWRAERDRHTARVATLEPAVSAFIAEVERLLALAGAALEPAASASIAEVERLEAPAGEMRRQLDAPDALRLAVEGLREALGETATRATSRAAVERARIETSAQLVDARRALAHAEALDARRQEAEAAFGGWARDLGATPRGGMGEPPVPGDEAAQRQRAPGLRPEDAEIWFDALSGVRDAVAAAERWAREVGDREARLADFVAATGSIAESVGAPRPRDASAALALVEPLRLRLVAAGEARTRRDERRARLRRAEELVAGGRAGRDEAEAQLAATLAAAGCEDEAAWRVRLARDDERAAAAHRIEAAEAALLGLLGRDWRAIAAAEDLAAGDLARWDGQAEELEVELAALAEQRDAVGRELGALDTRLRQLESSAEVAERAQAVAIARARLEEARRAWWRLAIARRLLTETFERFRRERQPAVVQRASAWLAEATDGAYLALEAEEGGSAMTFLAVDEAGVRHPADALSAGTTGLVYLCLRLALALDQGEQAAALPIIADDVLAHFDPDRAEAAIRLLARAADASRERQVLLFTCRPEAVAVVRRVVPAARVLELPRWAGRARPAQRAGQVTSVAPAATTASGPPSPTASVDDAVALLVAHGEPLGKRDILEALGLPGRAWRELRVALEADPRVDVQGERRGRRYAALAPP